MAIAQNSIVSPKIAPVVAPCAQGPIFGIVESASAPWTVLWNNGQRVAAIVDANLNEITEADSSVKDQFVGRLVKSTSPSGQTNFGQGICVACYKRGVDTYALVQNQAGGFYSEFPTASLEVA